MARVRLKVYRVGRTQPAAPGGAVIDLPFYRLFAAVSVGQGEGMVRAMVDTGSPYTIFPPRAWPNPDEPTGPNFPVDLFPAPPIPPTLDVGGRRYAYRWGRVEMVLRDVDVPAIAFPPVTVIGQFCVSRVWTDAERAVPPDQRRPELQHILLGLSSGLFDGRYLVLKPGPTEADSEAWVQDSPPAG